MNLTQSLGGISKYIALSCVLLGDGFKNHELSAWNKRKITQKNASTNFNNWDEAFWRLWLGDFEEETGKEDPKQKMDQGCGLHHQEHYSKMDQQRFTLNSHLDLSQNLALPKIGVPPNHPFE